ncbi:MAG: hypothetical protein FJW26_18925 [Acidimicrobiia bacterium]|nr:hypothetical protein [Acidimicrobiia bacterium]
MQKRWFLILASGVLLARWSFSAFALPVKTDGPKTSKGVGLKKAVGKLEVWVDGAPFTTYHYEGFKKPVFFPLRAATGTAVTRNYPIIADVPGEAQDHPHHKGLWFTHGDVNGVDFWSESTKTGKIVHRKFVTIRSGPKSGLLESENDWITANGETVLKEARAVTIYSQAGVRIMDFDLKLTALAQAVKFGDTKEGSFGIRLAQPFSEKDGGRIENSHGAQGEKDCWGKAADWVDFTTRIGSETMGVAIFDHPSSFRHPTYWHVRGYCLFAVNPFGLHDFYRDKTKDGSHTLQKGQSIRFRYRVYIHPGDAREAKIAEQYRAYARGAREKD